MIIDTGGYLGEFPFRKLNRTDPFSLSDYASGFGITHMIVSSIEAVFFKDTKEGNDILSDTLIRYAKEMKKGMLRYLPYYVVNPAYPGWEKDLTYALKNEGFLGIDLFPKYHGYSFDSLCLKSFMDLARRKKVPVRICSGFENIRQRCDLDAKCDPKESELLDMAKNYPDVLFIFNGFYSYDFLWQLEKSAIKNAYYDFSRLDVFPGVSDDMLRVIDNIGVDNLCFSTLSPFQYIEPQFIKMSHKAISKSDRNKILSSNLLKILPGDMK